MTIPPADIEAAILRLVGEAPAGKTIDPGLTARAVKPDERWHVLMPAVRRAAVALAEAGRIAIYRKGKPVDPADFKGVYRLGLPPQD